MSSILESRALRKALVVTLSSVAFTAATIGVYKAIHSPLFLVQVVEVTTQNADQIALSQAHPGYQADTGYPLWTPVNADQISSLASIPVGEINLFDLDLRSVEKKILKNEWIREVKLQKRFPQTLSITAVFREPQAILALDSGSLSYVDSDGKAFGRVSLQSQSDLPVLSGIESENSNQLFLALQLLDQWSKSSLGALTKVESLSFDPEHGYRAMISYDLNTALGKHLDWHLVRTRVDLGAGKDAVSGGKLSEDLIMRLSQVFEYLRHNSIAARQIYADAGKKIVVKTAHGS